MKGGVYTIRFAYSDKFYVGKTSNFRKRWVHHQWCLTNGVHHNAHLQSLFDKLGKESIAFVVEERLANAEARTVREQDWLDRFTGSPLLLNMASVSAPEVGGARAPSVRVAWNKGLPSPRKGIPRSNAEREAISAATIGKSKPRSVPVSDETRRRMSIAQRGHLVTAEAREAIRIAQLGKKRGPRSEADRAKISAANKGRVFTDAHRQKLSAAAKMRQGVAA